MRNKPHKSPVANDLENADYEADPGQTRAQGDARRSSDDLWHKINPMCKDCRKQCKATAAVTVVFCPLYEPK